jgi:hypothetical protein
MELKGERRVGEVEAYLWRCDYCSTAIVPGCGSVRDTALLGDCAVGTGDAVRCRVVKTARRAFLSSRFAEVAVAVAVSLTVSIPDVVRVVGWRRMQR